MSFVKDIVALLRVEQSTGERLNAADARRLPFSYEQVSQIRYLIREIEDDPEEDRLALGHNAATTLVIRLCNSYLEDHARVARIREALEAEISVSEVKQV